MLWKSHPYSHRRPIIPEVTSDAAAWDLWCNPSSPCTINTFSAAAGRSPESIPITGPRSQQSKQNHSTLGNSTESAGPRYGRQRRPSPLLRISRAANSHLVAKPTNAGYLFLLTAPALNMKSQVPLHVSCPDHNPRHQAIPLASCALNEGKSSAHK